MQGDARELPTQNGEYQCNGQHGAIVILEIYLVPIRIIGFRSEVCQHSTVDLPPEQSFVVKLSHGHLLVLVEHWLKGHKPSSDFATLTSIEHHCECTTQSTQLPIQILICRHTSQTMEQ